MNKPPQKVFKCPKLKFLIMPFSIQALLISITYPIDIFFDIIELQESSQIRVKFTFGIIIEYRSDFFWLYTKVKTYGQICPPPLHPVGVGLGLE